MSTATYEAPRASLRDRIAYNLRVIGVTAMLEFKLKYADSALGYVWSLAKPLAYFGVLYVVFGRFFKTGVENFPLYLLTGLVLYMFFVDAVGATLPSVVSRGSILRRLSFPPLVIPASATVTVALTFLLNSLAVAVFVAASGETLRWQWLLIPLLLIELYVFILGVGLIVATLFVRLKDIAQIWDLAAQLLLFGSPIMYPITILPEWAQQIVTLNPFVQIIQDVRSVLLASGNPTVDTLLGQPQLRLIPIALAVATFVFGLWLYRRESPRFAESV
jgi:ABC-2 type transport system permease protein